MPYCVIIELYIEEGLTVRLNKVKSKNAVSYYIIRSVRRNGKNSSEIVKKLGTEKSIKETYGVKDVDAWAKEQLRIMNEEETASDHKVLIPLSTDRVVDADVRLSFNAGYLFLQQIYYQLGLPSICKKMRIPLSMILITYSQGSSTEEYSFHHQNSPAMNSRRILLKSQSSNFIRYTEPLPHFLRTQT